MTMLDINSALAAEHVRDLHRAAAAARLAATARRGRPTVWARLAHHASDTMNTLRGTVRRTQLGPTNTYCACS